MWSVMRSFAGAKSRIETAPFGARFTVGGVVGKDTVGQLIGAVVTDLAVRPPLVALCDYSRADMGVAARSMLVAHRKAGVPASWPAAMIVPPEQLQLWRDYAWLQGQSGNLRGIFTRAEDAEKWCAEMAAIRASEARYLQRVR